MAQAKAEDRFLVDEGKAFAEIIIRDSPANSTRLAAAEPLFRVTRTVSK